MSRNQSPHGVEVADPPSDVLNESTDLKSLLTAILGNDAEERDDQAQLVAEVDARVAGVVHELGLEELLVERHERQRVEVPSQAVTFVVQEIETTAPPADADTQRPTIGRVLPLGIVASLIALLTVVWLTSSGDPADSARVVVTDPPPAASAPPPNALSPAAATTAPASEVAPLPTPAAAASGTGGALGPVVAVEAREPEATTPAAATRSPSPVVALASRAAAESPRSARPESRISITPVRPAIRVITPPAPTPAPPSLVPEMASTALEVGPSSELRRAALADPPTEAASVAPTPDSSAGSARAVSSGTVTASETSTIARVDSPAIVTPGPPPSSGTSPRAISQRRDPRVLSKVMARYPNELKAAGIGGVVRLRLTIDARGRIVKIQAIGGHELLRREAVAAVQRWRYEPSTVGGVPVEAEATVLFTFNAQARRER